MGVKNYFKNQFKVYRFNLEHEEASDFYLCCWQRNRSPLPLLYIRLLVFLGCLSILISSLTLTVQGGLGGYWLIFMTHWGLLLITITGGLAFAVSARAYFQGPIDSTFGMPWYMKSYWVAFNISVPLAFFISLFYFAFLTELAEEYAIDAVLDLFIHGINSVLMLVLLLTSQHPSHLLHFYHTVVVALLYMIFSLIYYFAGGTGPDGSNWIYPMLDWSDPGLTIGVIFASAVALIIVYSLVVLISVCRDYLSKRFVRNSNSMTLIH